MFKIHSRTNGLIMVTLFVIFRFLCNIWAILVPFFTPRPIRCRSIVVACVRLYVHTSVRMFVYPSRARRANWRKFIKLAHKMYLANLQKLIDFERSRSMVKATRGQKIKIFDRPHFENCWVDSLQTINPKCTASFLSGPSYIIARCARADIWVPRADIRSDISIRGCDN